MKITTKTGDKGETSLYRGGRVSKADHTIDLLGELDELQASVALAKFDQKGEQNFKELLDQVVDHMYRMMGIVGFQGKLPEGQEAFSEKEVSWLEKMMEEIGERGEKVKDLNRFIRPGSNLLAARLNFARVTARRVERKFVKWLEARGKTAAEDKQTTQDLQWCLKYLNRLSDLLFLMGFVREEDSKLDS